MDENDAPAGKRLFLNLMDDEFRRSVIGKELHRV